LKGGKQGQTENRKARKKDEKRGSIEKQMRKRAIKIVEGGKEGTKKPRLYRQRGK
jgi:hypothetical protein